MPKKPIIGISLDLANDSEKRLYNPLPWYAIRENYPNSILKAGGVPLMIPYQYETIEEILSIIDGLIIPGGDDIHPKSYNQEFIHSKTESNIPRDDFELLITQKALEKHIPFLGICRGMQLLNVVCNGDLIQHIPDYLKNSDINHQPAIELKSQLSHPITIEPNTILARLANNNEIFVNSNHHQAVGKLGSGLKIAAVAPDGIIEAIESIIHKFVLGVEWHPEYLNDNGLDLNIFKEFIKATREYNDPNYV